MDLPEKILGGITGKGFQKGADPRRNMNGRPRTYDALRKLALKVLEEQVTVKDKATGEQFRMSRSEMILRKWASSGNGIKEQNLFLAAYGKAPEEIIINPQSTVTLKVVWGGRAKNGNGNGSGDGEGSVPS